MRTRDRAVCALWVLELAAEGAIEVSSEGDRLRVRRRDQVTTALT